MGIGKIDKAFVVKGLRDDNTLADMIGVCYIAGRMDGAESCAIEKYYVRWKAASDKGVAHGEGLIASVEAATIATNYEAINLSGLVQGNCGVYAMSKELVGAAVTRHGSGAKQDSVLACGQVFNLREGATIGIALDKYIAHKRDDKYG